MEKGQNQKGKNSRGLVNELRSSYKLCQECLRRQLDHSKGKEVREYSFAFPSSSECYICQGIVDQLEEFTNKVAASIAGYEFHSFSVGVSLARDFYEREDELRSKFKLRGGETLRSDISKRIAQSLRKSRKNVARAFRNPDLTVIVSLPQGAVSVLPRPVVLFGRYTKTERGIRQKKKVCQSCSGLGCSSCSFEGEVGKSIESLLGKELVSLFGGSKAKFTWVGGEDSKSLVLGKGRPFFASISEPRKRSFPKNRRTALPEGLRVHISKILATRPRDSQPFKTTALLNVVPAGANFPAGLRAGKFILRRPTDVSSNIKSRPATRRIYSIRVDSVTSSKLLLRIVFEGGLSLKNFVSGGEGFTYPSLSDLLGFKVVIDEAQPFDVLDVKLMASLSVR